MFLSSSDLVYTNGIFHVWFRDQEYFQSSYYFNNDNKPKPFMTDNPEKSYLNGCCSLMCSFLYNKRLYKCAALGTLRNFLKHHDSLEDIDWQKYLNYKPLDLETCTIEESTKFSNTKYNSISECDMCPASSQNFRKTEDKVLPIKFHKSKI
jgi:hypothetical protein